MSKARAETVVQVSRVALSIDEACDALGVSWDTWDEHIAPHVRIVRLGRRKLVPVAELERWLAKEAERQMVPTGGRGGRRRRASAQDPEDEQLRLPTRARADRRARAATATR